MFLWTILTKTIQLGSFTSDWMGPRLALSVFVAAQGAVGFIMSGCYAELREPQNIAGFVVIYGVFLMLGEMGPGGKSNE